MECAGQTHKAPCRYTGTVLLRGFGRVNVMLGTPPHSNNQLTRVQSEADGEYIIFVSLAGWMTNLLTL